MMENIEAGLPALGDQKPKLISKGRLALIIIIGIAVVALLTAYVGITIINAIKPKTVRGQLPIPSMNASLVEQDLLSYNSVQQYVPYVLLSYSSYNTTAIIANASLYRYPPPTRIFLVNVTNECFDCGDISGIESAMYSELISYNIIQNISNVTNVEPSDLLSVPNDSLLIVLNGLLPNEFVQNVTGTNITELDYLLQRHVSILYVGQSFTNVLLPESVVVPAPQIPTSLTTRPFGGISGYKGNGFYFNKSTFSFTFGHVYSGYLTYENMYNGSIAAFPNTETAWTSANQVGSDVAKAVAEMFWLPKYAYGTRTIITPNPANSSGQFGLVLNATPLKYNPNTAGQADRNGSIRIMLTYAGIYPYGSTKPKYKYISAKPQLFDNGTLGIYGGITDNQTVPLTFSIQTHSNVTANIQPHLSIYNLNMTQIYSTPLPFIHNVSNNFTFLLPYERLELPPGTGYIVKLHSFYGAEYGGAYFNVSPITLKLLAYNITSDKFYFSVISNKMQMTNLPYTITLNGKYPLKGVVKNGTIYYAVPTGTPTITGQLNFSINVSGITSHYNAAYYPLPFTINDQYIEIVVVVVLMIIVVLFVRAPNRDEFYIDVPNLPEQKKTEIKIKAKEVVDAFDALNRSYHWKYMPLSQSEVKAAVGTYIKYNNIPVSLTYSNTERILDQLAAKKYIVGADSLYAPSEWLAASSHDIEYLATFKKLRIFLVTHGYLFTDMDASQNSDIIATLHNERKYIIIYSKSSKFQNVPVYEGSKTYIVFLNAYMLDEFKSRIYGSSTPEAEQLKIYMAADYVRLVDADNPVELVG